MGLSFWGIVLFAIPGVVLFYWLFLDLVSNKFSTMSELVKKRRFIVGCICIVLTAICFFSSL